MKARGGRPKKPVKAGKISVEAVIFHIKRLKSNYSCNLDNSVTVNVPSELKCSLCSKLLTDPIELITCQKYACKNCFIQKLRSSDVLLCPCCNSSHVQDFETIRQPSNVILAFIGSLRCKCTLCKGEVELHNIPQHKQSNCKELSVQQIDGVLSKSQDSPLTQAEKKLQISLLSRSVLGGAETVQVQTGGQPITLMQVTSPRISSDQASASTVRRRSSELKRHRRLISGGDECTQLAHEVTSCGRERRQELVENLRRQGKITISIPAREALAMKVDLHLAYLKTRDMRRWLKQWGVELSSEKKMRATAQEYVGDNLRTELVPFTFPLHDGSNSFEVRNVPMSYVVDLWEKVEDMLSMNDNDSTGVHRLTWHEGRIPSDELWIKLGGDKGGGTFKMSFQIVNVDHPNSPNNTCVFCSFQAPDNPANLRIALARYTDQIEALHTKTWRGKRVRPFLSGDYEFLCHTYGLSGASGKYCCMWCLISSDQLRNPPPNVPARTTDGIIQDYQSFTADGAKVKKAKLYHNAIREPFFPGLPLLNVCPPGLHLSLGIFYRLFSLLENQCHELDAIVASEDCAEKGGVSFARYSKALEKITTLKRSMTRISDELNCQNQIITSLFGMSDAEHPEEDPQIIELFQEANEMNESVAKLIKEYHNTEAEIARGFKTYDGPFVKELDTALASFNVRRQAYYSGTFVGNHVHRTLKKENTTHLLRCIEYLGRRFTPAVSQKADEICRKFSVAFELFSQCHTLYDKRYVTPAEVDTLEANISSFTKYYRDSFPKATVTPKIHILETHTVPWLREWGCGVAFGLMGEQGAESIHHWFNLEERKYSSIADPVERLHSSMKNHYVNVAPHNSILKPAIKKRCLKSSQELENMAN